MGDVTTCKFVGDASLNNESFIYSAIFWLLQISIMGQICSLLWTCKNKKAFSFREASPLDPHRGLCPWTRWGLRPQTPVIGSRSALAMQFELCAVLYWSLKKPCPLVITPVFCCRRTEPGGYFCWKLTLTRTPGPIRPTRRGPDPNWPTNGSKQGLFIRGFCRTTPETIGDNKTEFNRILCTSKSEAAVTNNKKTRCKYVLANYWQTRSIARPLCDSRATC